MRINVKKRPMGSSPTPTQSIAIAGSSIATGDSSGVIRVGERVLATLPSGVKSMDFSPCGNFLLSVSECGKCLVHNIQTFRFVKNLVPEGNVITACWGNIMPYYAYSTVVDTIHIPSLNKDFCTGGVKRLQFFHNDWGLRAYSSDGFVTEWDISSEGKPVKSYFAPFQFQHDLAYNIRKGNMVVFSGPTLEPLVTLNHPADILAVAVDDYRIIVGLSNKEIIVWYYVIEQEN